MSTPNPTREQVLLALARADGQPWGSIVEATPHAAEMMYGKQADAVLALLPAAPTPEQIRAQFLTRYDHAAVRDRYDADLMMAGFADGATWAADPCRTVAQVKADALREAARLFAEGEWQEAWCSDVQDDVSAVLATVKWFNERADRIERGEGQ